MAKYEVSKAYNLVILYDKETGKCEFFYDKVSHNWTNRINDGVTTNNITHYFKDPSKPTTNELLMVELQTGLPVHMVADYIKENEL